MANRIVGNVYIIDSGLISLTWPSAAKIGAVAFWGVDSTSRLTVTLSSDTRDSIFALSNQANVPGLSGITFGYQGWSCPNQPYILNLVAGTGYIYFV